MSKPPPQLYNIMPWLLERISPPHRAAFDNVERLHTFIKEKIQKHQETLDPNAPRDYIDCFLTRLQQVRLRRWTRLNWIQTF